MPRLLPAVLFLALALGLSACSDDEADPAPSGGTPSPSATPDPAVSLPATVAQAVTPGHLDEVCPDGRFTEADDTLGTLPRAYAGKAERILTYDCDDLIDQVVWAELPDPEVATALLDAEAADGASVFVAGSTVVAVSERLVTEEELDVAAYFEALSEACGCGRFTA